MVVLHTVVIRYSLLLEDFKAWIIARNEEKSYKDTLFDSERLDSRLNLFKLLTLPCLAQQNLIEEHLEGTNIHKLQVFLATSEQLPQVHKQELNELAEKYDWLNVCYLPSRGTEIESVITSYVEGLYNQLKKPILYSNIRLDDDDILSSNFLNRLEPYATEENIGRVISLAKGYYGIYESESNSFTHISDLFSPKLALGLALINKYDEKGYHHELRSIYEAGNHTLIDHRLPVITDGRLPAYIRTVHNHADSNDERKIQWYLKNNNPVHPVKVLQTMGMEIPISFNYLPLNIKKNELKKIKVYHFHLVNKKLKIDLPIQMCIWKQNLLVQVCKYNPEERLIFTLRRNERILFEDSTVNNSQLQITVPLEVGNLTSPNQIEELRETDQVKFDEANPSNLLNLEISIQNTSYKQTFEIK